MSLNLVNSNIGILKVIYFSFSSSIAPAEPNTVQYVRHKEEVKQIRNVKQVYEQQLNRANDLYMEVCAVRLQLEQREKEVSE